MVNDPFGTAPAADDNDDDFDINLPEEDAGFCMPEGPYVVEVTDLEKAVSEAGNNMWIWYFQVCEGNNTGFGLRVYTALTPAAMWKLRETLEALGLGQAGRSSKFKRQDAIGKKCWANVVDDEYKGVKRSTISSLSPMKKAAPVADATVGKFAPIDDDCPF